MKKPDSHRAPCASDPLVISNQNAISWDEGADVVIVGFGGAGAAAAIQALDCGAAVLAVDRFEGGGATALSGGILYAGATRHQAASGFKDTPEEMGLYAAGRSAVGLCSNSYMSGMSIADTVFSGRRAACSATKSLSTRTAPIADEARNIQSVGP